LIEERSRSILAGARFVGGIAVEIYDTLRGRRTQLERNLGAAEFHEIVFTKCAFGPGASIGGLIRLG
jgi:hypothetical protein